MKIKFGTDVADDLTVGDEDTFIITGSGDDFVVSGYGDNVISAGSGADVIYAGVHEKTSTYEWEGETYTYTYYTSYGAGNNIVDAGSGDDIVQTGDGDDAVMGGSGNDSIYTDWSYSSGGDDRVDAGSGDDYVYGGGGSDFIVGGSGNDTLDGGYGADLLIANDGEADRLYLGAGDHAMVDGLDSLIFTQDGNFDVVGFGGATADTHFDFTDLGECVYDDMSGTATQGISRDNITFDRDGFAHVDVATTGVHIAIAGLSYHDMAGLDASIASGHTILVTALDYGGKG